MVKEEEFAGKIQQFVENSTGGEKEFAVVTLGSTEEAETYVSRKDGTEATLDNMRDAFLAALDHVDSQMSESVMGFNRGNFISEVALALNAHAERLEEQE